VTRTRDHLIDEVLARNSVDVNRVPVGRLIDTMPAIKEEGDLTIVPIVEETVVVERRLMLKEELHIRRVQTTERYQQTVKLRYQTAEVTGTPAQKPTADGESVGGPARPNPEDT
jgi:stress response protein YsnF